MPDGGDVTSSARICTLLDDADGTVVPDGERGTVAPAPARADEGEDEESELRSTKNPAPAPTRATSAIPAINQRNRADMATPCWRTRSTVVAPDVPTE